MAPLSSTSRGCAAATAVPPRCNHRIGYCECMQSVCTCWSCVPFMLREHDAGAPPHVGCDCNDLGGPCTGTAFSSVQCQRLCHGMLMAYQEYLSKLQSPCASKYICQTAHMQLLLHGKRARSSASTITACLPAYNKSIFPEAPVQVYWYHPSHCHIWCCPTPVIGHVQHDHHVITGPQTTIAVSTS